MRIRIRRGLDVPVAGAPSLGNIEDGPAVGQVAVLGRDYPGLRPRMMATEGDEVRLGQPLFADKANPRILVTAPGSGRIAAINRGPRRVLESVVIDLAGDQAPPRFEPVLRDGDSAGRTTLVERLLETGLWSALRVRPFGHVADPERPPGSIFVTAIDTNPLAAPPVSIIDTAPERFAAGLQVLAGLTDGAVHVCVAPGPEPAMPEHPRIRMTAFEGPHPAGLPGTHIHFLDPVDAGYHVWHIGYQDVMAIGALFAEGLLDPVRVISLAGPMVARPRLLRTRLGASLAQLLHDELLDGACRVISGPILSGHRAAGNARFLGRYHDQVCVLAEGAERAFLGWLAPGAKRYSSTRAFLSALLPSRPMNLDTSQNGSPRAMVAIGSYERVMPMDILPGPLLKAIVVGDTDSAIDLGCLELIEEDVALLSFVDCGKFEYGPVLRDTLDKIGETH